MEYRGADQPDEERPQKRQNRHHSALRRAVEEDEEAVEARHAAQYPDLVAHEFHAVDQYAEAEHRSTEALHSAPFGKTEQHPQRRGGQRHRADVERDQLRRERRTDVRAEDDPQRLTQSQKSGIDEPRHHHRHGGAGLHRGGDRRSGDERRKAVAGEHPQQIFEPVARGVAQAAAHEFHAEDQKRDPAQHRGGDLPRIHGDDLDVAAAYGKSLFGPVDVDGDPAAAGVLAERNHRFRHAPGVRHALGGFDLRGNGGAVAHGGVGAHREADGDARYAAPVPDEPHRQRRREFLPGEPFARVALEFHAVDHPQPELRIGCTDHARGEELVARRPGAELDCDHAARVRNRRRGHEFELRARFGNELHADARRRTAAGTHLDAHRGIETAVRVGGALVGARKRAEFDALRLFVRASGKEQNEGEK